MNTPKFFNTIRYIIYSCFFVINCNAHQMTFPDSICSEIEQCNGDSVQISNVLFSYGAELDEMNNIEAAKTYLQRAFNISKRNKYDANIAKMGNYLGGIHWVEGDCKASTIKYKEALASAEAVSDRVMIATIKMNLSGNMNASGQSALAIELAMDALAIKENDRNLNGICYDYVMIGEIFQNIDNLEKWKHYINKAYQYKETEGCCILSDEVMIYNNLGTISEAEKRYDDALAYYDTIRQLSEPTGYDQGIGIALLNSALIHQLLGSYEKAIQLCDEATPYLGEVPYYIMANNNIRSELYMSMKAYNKARIFVQNNLHNSEIIYYPKLKLNAFKQLYLLNYHLANYEQAFAWNDSLSKHKEEMQEEENAEFIHEIETKYETEKKEQQIELLSAENRIKNQRIILFITVSIALLILIVAGALLYQRKKKIDRHKQDNLKQQLLRSQMNPHFIFNALGSIQNYMLKNDTRQAASYLNNFASLTRSVLEHSSADAVPLDEEISALENYILLEQMRLSHRFNYHIDYDSELETELICIPPMLIQPFVENAIKHGLKEKKEGILKLSITECGDVIKVCIDDNGKGFDQSSHKASSHKSMALKIFHQRIALLRKKHLQKAQIDIKTKLNIGTQVTITIPIIQD